MSVSAYVLIPQATRNQIGLAGASTRAEYPTLYLLHGLSDDHTIWMRRTSIERYVAERNLAVVMPAVARSFYQDMAAGPKYWTFLSEELPTLMRRFFPLSAAREDNFAAGLSMGGYGALRLGLTYPERYAAAASLSGALDLGKRLKQAGKLGSRIQAGEWEALFGPTLDLGNGDLFALAERVSASAQRPSLWIDCGNQDELLGDSRDFHAHLENVRLEHHYEEPPGVHNWEYWDRQIQRVLAWLPLKS